MLPVIPVTFYHQVPIVVDGITTIQDSQIIPMRAEIEVQNKTIAENGNVHNITITKLTIRTTAKINTWKPRDYSVDIDGIRYKIDTMYPYPKNPKMFTIVTLAKTQS